jgi:hypothetical protein
MGMMSRASGKNSGPPGFGGTNDYSPADKPISIPTPDCGTNLWLAITNLTNHAAHSGGAAFLSETRHRAPGSQSRRSRITA